MQDFKTAFLLGVCPRQQFAAMLIGSSASIFVSVAAYALYTSTYEVPGPKFPAPTAEIWLDMAKLVSVDEVSITYHLWLHQRLCPGTLRLRPDIPVIQWQGTCHWLVLWQCWNHPGAWQAPPVYERSAQLAFRVNAGRRSKH